MMNRWESPIRLRCAVLLATAAWVPAARAADNIGVNLDGMAYYFKAMQWVDAKNMFSPWFLLNDFNSQNVSPALTADGYPVLQGTSISFLTNYPDGNYLFSYQGTGTLQLSGMHPTVTNTVFDAATDTTSFTLNINRQGDGLIQMNVVNSSPTDPLHNIHMYTPGYSTSQAFTSQFLQRVQPFPALRFMDWMNTNNNPVVSWADRVTPQTFARTSSKGVAYEDVINLANTVNRDLWINVPARANDDYIRHMADLFRDNVNPNLKIHVEYSNEVWNSGFSQFFDNLGIAKADPNLTNTDDFGRSAQQYALTAKHADDIFRQEFGANTASRLSFVYGSQSGDPYWTSTGLGYIQSRFGNVNRYFNEVAIAPYFGNDLGALNTPNLTADQLNTALQSFIDTTLRQWIRDQKTLANTYGLSLSAYEGGQSLDQLQNGALAQSFQTDPRMGTLTGQLFDVWKQEGGGLFMNFSHIGAFWGALQSSTDLGSPKWQTLMQRLLPGGDANLDGVVDINDLKIFALNYQKTGMWWEQGDFNGDGVVDSQDLALLAANYSTPSTFSADLATAQAFASADVAAPEPASLSLLALGSTALLLRRRRNRQPEPLH